MRQSGSASDEHGRRTHTDIAHVTHNNNVKRASGQRQPVRREHGGHWSVCITEFGADFDGGRWPVGRNDTHSSRHHWNRHIELDGAHFTGIDAKSDVIHSRNAVEIQVAERGDTIAVGCLDWIFNALLANCGKSLEFMHFNQAAVRKLRGIRDMSQRHTNFGARYGSCGVISQQGFHRNKHALSNCYAAAWNVKTCQRVGSQVCSFACLRHGIQ